MTPSTLPARAFQKPGGKSALIAASPATALAIFLWCVAGALAYEKLGIFSLFTFALLPAALILWLQRRIAKARASVVEAEQVNDDLRRSNADLHDLLEFTAGLSAQTHDSEQLAAYARASLSRLTGARVTVTASTEAPERGVVLESAGRVVGGLAVDGGDTERWERLRDSVVPQLSAALQSIAHLEEGRRAQVEAIAALSRSMEAKDDYSGGHAERVSDIAVGLAKRLGYAGEDLDAIEIGAVMHDIGKIGIPESILHKPGPLDNNEWIVMKRHPVISELILSETDLSPIVLEIARSSHERIDGQGYPDGLIGDDIPMPARIVLVANAFDALTTDRPYRRARRPRAAVDEIVANKHKQFCPQVVDALVRLYGEDPALLGEVTLSVVAG